MYHKLPGFSFITRTILSSQSGIAPIIVIFFLFLAVIGGTYLVQSRTNIVPFAAETSTMETVISCERAREIFSVGGSQSDSDGCSYSNNGTAFTPTADNGCTVTLTKVYTVSNCPELVKNSKPATATIDYCSITLPDGRYQSNKGITFTSDCQEVEGYGDNIGRQTTYTCNNPPYYTPGASKDCKLSTSTSPALAPNCSAWCSSLGYEGCEVEGCYFNASQVANRICPKPILDSCVSRGHDGCEITGRFTNTCLDNPKGSSTNPPPSVQRNTGKSNTPITVAPTDAASCQSEKTCIFSTGQNQCTIGICKDKDKGCAFNSEDCSFTNAIEKECISTTVYAHENGDYKVSGKAGAEVDCPAVPAQGGSAGAISTGKASSNASGQDYSKLDEVTCGRTGSTQYCDDEGQFVTELPTWQNGKCVGVPAGATRACKKGDKYSNGDEYTGLDGLFANSNGENTDVNKLAEDCGFVQNESTLNIPFFKISPGENLSVNREDCKKLLATQLTYFEQANKDAAKKLMDEAEKIGATVEKKEDGTYEVKGDLENEEVKKLAEKVNTVNEAQKSVTECKDNTGEEQAACLKGSQEKTQTAATTANAAQLQGYVKKFDQVISGELPEGKEEMCVKADLGVAPFMDSEGIGSKHVGEEYRLLVCRKKGEAKIKWRVLLLDSDTEDTSNTSKAERLAKLHPTGTGDPVFPVTINTCVTLTSNKPGDIEAILKPYVDAARAGTGKAAGCERIKNPNDTGGNGSQRREAAKGATGTTPSGGATTPTGGSTTPKTENPAKPGTDGGKTNKCSTDAGCQEKNDPLNRKGTYKCNNANGQCYLAP